jgi:hypothetical protein
MPNEDKGFSLEPDASTIRNVHDELVGSALGKTDYVLCDVAVAKDSIEVRTTISLEGDAMRKLSSVGVSIVSAWVNRVEELLSKSPIGTLVPRDTIRTQAIDFVLEELKYRLLGKDPMVEMMKDLMGQLTKLMDPDQDGPEDDDPV